MNADGRFTLADARIELWERIYQLEVGVNKNARMHFVIAYERWMKVDAIDVIALA